MALTQQDTTRTVLKTKNKSTSQIKKGVLKEHLASNVLILFLYHFLNRAADLSAAGVSVALQLKHN